MSATEVTAEKTSRWEDYIDVFFSPAQLFARRANEAAGPAFWTLLVLCAITYYAFLPVNEMLMRAGIIAQAQTRGADPAEVQAAAGGMVRIMTYAGGVMSAVAVAIAVAVAALLLMLIGRAVEVKGTYRQAFMIATFAGFTFIVAQLATSITGMIVGEGVNPLRDLSFGPLRFLDYASLPSVVPPLLRRLELFSIWQAVLWGVGLHVVMKASKAQAAITAVATSLIVAIPGIITAALNLGAKTAG